MKDVLISIRPQWVEKIVNGEKTIEIRKTKPKLEPPFKCYIYMTAGFASYPVEINGKPYICNNNGGKVVIGEFTCDRIDEYILTLDNGDNYATKDFMFSPLKEACLTQDEIVEYGKGKSLYGWHISDLKIYDKPKELREFRKICEYRNEDGSCQYRKILCDRVKFDFNPNGSVNLADCHDHMGRPPQSWCYVEANNGK